MIPVLVKRKLMKPYHSTAYAPQRGRDYWTTPEV